MLYSDVEIDTIAALLRDGHTSTSIAAVIPGRSRNAIVGVVLRNPILKAIGFARRASGWQNYNAHRSRPAKAARIQEPKPPKPPKQAIVKAEPARIVCVEIEPRMVRLVDLMPCDCRWPIGDPRSEAFGFCGHSKREGSSYCAAHAKVAKQKPIVRKRKAMGRTLKEAR
jgi:hypothetical protein